MSEWTQVDEALLAAVQRVLSLRVGREAAISRGELVRAVMRRLARRVSERQVRAAVNLLRKRGVLICSTGGPGGGYWMAANRQEVEDFLTREVHPRAMDLLEVEQAMREAMQREFGQPTLFELGVAN